MVILFLLANNVCGCNGIEEHHCGTLGLSFSKWSTLMKSTYMSLCDLDRLPCTRKLEAITSIASSGFKSCCFRRYLVAVRGQASTETEPSFSTTCSERCVDNSRTVRLFVLTKLILTVLRQHDGNPVRSSFC